MRMNPGKELVGVAFMPGEGPEQGGKGKAQEGRAKGEVGFGILMDFLIAKRCVHVFFSHTSHFSSPKSYPI
jgi:hypothetical protein